MNLMMRWPARLPEHHVAPSKYAHPGEKVVQNPARCILTLPSSQRRQLQGVDQGGIEEKFSGSDDIDKAALLLIAFLVGKTVRSRTQHVAIGGSHGQHERRQHDDGDADRLQMCALDTAAAEPGRTVWEVHSSERCHVGGTLYADHLVRCIDFLFSTTIQLMLVQPPDMRSVQNRLASSATKSPGQQLQTLGVITASGNLYSTVYVEGGMADRSCTGRHVTR